MKTEYSWASAPILEIAGPILILVIGPLLWTYLSGSPYGFPAEIAFSFSFAPFFAIPILVASLLTIASRAQWMQQKTTARPLLNAALLLTYLTVFPLLFWNMGYWLTYWLFGMFSYVLLVFLPTPLGLISLVLGATANVVITAAVHYLKPRLGLSHSGQVLVPGCLNWVVYLGLLAGPFLIAYVLDVTPLGPVSLSIAYALYLGALLPALWPHFIIGGRRTNPPSTSSLQNPNRLDDQKKPTRVAGNAGSQLPFDLWVASSPHLSLDVMHMTRQAGDPFDIQDWVGRLQEAIRTRRADDPTLVVLLLQSEAVKRNPKAVDALIQMLRKHRDDSLVRASAAIGLGASGDSRVVQHLLPLLEDNDIRVRASAAMAFSKNPDKRAVPPLLRLLKEDYYLMRVHAAEALGRIGDPTAEKPLSDALQREQNEEARSAIARALERLQSAAKT